MQCSVARGGRRASSWRPARCGGKTLQNEQRRAKRKESRKSLALRLSSNLFDSTRLEKALDPEVWSAIMEPFELLTKRNWLLVNSICAFLMTVLVCSFIFCVSSVLCTCLAFSNPNTDSYNDAPRHPRHCRSLQLRPHYAPLHRLGRSSVEFRSHMHRPYSGSPLRPHRHHQPEPSRELL